MRPQPQAQGAGHPVAGLLRDAQAGGGMECGPIIGRSAPAAA